MCTQSSSLQSIQIGVFLNKAHYIHIDREVTVSNFEVIDTLMYEANVVEEVDRVVGDRGVKWEDM